MREIILPIKNGTSLPIKNTEVLLYDESSQMYYSTTRESLLREQDNKIKELEKKVTEKLKEIEEFKNMITDNYNKFITQYKETNEKVIKMIEGFIKKGE